LSAEPPRLLVCVNKSASAHDAILRNGVFCVNVLSQSQSNLAQVFATTDSMDQRFQEGEWAGLETGSPVLENAMVSFDCRIGETVAQSTHTIVIGDVVAMRGGSGSEPLLYYDGAYGRVLNG
jgi:flavin reductase